MRCSLTGWMTDMLFSGVTACRTSSPFFFFLMLQHSGCYRHAFLQPTVGSTVTLSVDCACALFVQGVRGSNFLRKSKIQPGKWLTERGSLDEPVPRAFRRRTCSSLPPNLSWDQADRGWIPAMLSLPPAPEITLKWEKGSSGNRRENSNIRIWAVFAPSEFKMCFFTISNKNEFHKCSSWHRWN